MKSSASISGAFRAIGLLAKASLKDWIIAYLSRRGALKGFFGSCCIEIVDRASLENLSRLPAFAVTSKDEFAVAPLYGNSFFFDLWDVVEGIFYGVRLSLSLSDFLGVFFSSSSRDTSSRYLLIKHVDFSLAPFIDEIPDCLACVRYLDLLTELAASLIGLPVCLHFMKLEGLTK